MRLLVLVLIPLLTGCWLFQAGTNPNTGLPTPSPADSMSKVLPFPWNLLVAAALPTITTAVAAWEAKKRGVAIKQVSEYADTIEKAETAAQVAVAKADLVAQQVDAGTKDLVRKIRKKVI